MGDTYFLQNGYVIDFVEVTEDSRCPSDATCVWEGQARAIVMLCKDGKKVTTKELLFKGNKEEEFSHSFGKEETKITYNLMPYPKQNTLGKLDYYLEFIIE
ncbi:hypothetical protein [Mesonia sp. K7]|uniref:hypothetical protein n=1 Tax=Mesonia sp. K7 TaxID=2218606 RepID=UPI000DAA2D9A|nr:hypothetical protein [Mesonia sp. K7]PZD77455.1 hypothetical protein DNG35_09065 [Mesonia sp. K7]